MNLKGLIIDERINEGFVYIKSSKCPFKKSFCDYVITKTRYINTDNNIQIGRCQYLGEVDNVYIPKARQISDYYRFFPCKFKCNVPTSIEFIKSLDKK